MNVCATRLTLRVAIAAAAFAVGLGGSLQAQTPAETASSKLAQAVEAQQQGWLVSSRKLLEEAAAIDPDTPGLKFQRAFQELREGHPRKAAAFARASLVAGQKISDARTLLGLLALQDKNYEEAEEHMRYAVEADPENSRGYYNLSEVLRWRGRPREALVQLEIAQKKQPNDPVLPLKIRLTHIEIGERLTFVKPKSSADSSNSDPTWTLTEAALALRGGKTDKAVELLNAARDGLQPQFFYPLLKEDHFFQAYKSDPSLQRFFE
jgi:tetratricopeptide (TPR) repeat protein